MSEAVRYLAVIVCGDRAWEDPAMVNRHLDRLLESYDRVLIISGGARGADRAAHNWAKAQDPARVKFELFKANWKSDGRRAGMIRNVEMLNRLTALAQRGCKVGVLAFKDTFGQSHSGTEHMVKIAKQAHVRGKIVRHAA